jgi:predicted O-methyltransferase YrrM
MKHLLNRSRQAIASRAPESMKGILDLLDPSLAEAWGGPLNGQERRMQIIRDLARVIEFDRVIETGTYRGTTTRFFSAEFHLPIDTVEGNRRFFVYCKLRMAFHRHVTISFGDSRRFLRRLGALPRSSVDTIFVYLDAHWGEDLPLREEIEIVAAACPRAVIMIDDFEVPGDDGYTFDDYGPGKRLTESYLPLDTMPGWSVYYPVSHSGEETGMKRGCCVLVAPSLGAMIQSVESLRMSDRRATNA